MNSNPKVQQKKKAGRPVDGDGGASGLIISQCMSKLGFEPTSLRVVEMTNLSENKLIGTTSAMQSFWNSVSDEIIDPAKVRSGRSGVKDLHWAGAVPLGHRLKAYEGSTKTSPRRGPTSERAQQAAGSSVRDKKELWRSKVAASFQAEQRPLETDPGVEGGVKSGVNVEKSKSFWENVVQERANGAKAQGGRKDRLEPGKVGELTRIWDGAVGPQTAPPGMNGEAKLRRLQESKAMMRKWRFHNVWREVNDLRARWETVAKLTEFNVPSSDRFKTSNEEGLLAAFMVDGVDRDLPELGLGLHTSDVEMLCLAVHYCGKNLFGKDDVRKIITFQKLAQVFPRDDLAGALAEAHKHKVISFDGEVQDFEPETEIILEFSAEEILEEFSKMRSKLPEIFGTNHQHGGSTSEDTEPSDGEDDA